MGGLYPGAGYCGQYSVGTVANVPEIIRFELTVRRNERSDATIRRREAFDAPIVQRVPFTTER